MVDDRFGHFLVEFEQVIIFSAWNLQPKVILFLPSSAQAQASARLSWFYCQSQTHPDPTGKVCLFDIFVQISTNCVTSAVLCAAAPLFEPHPALCCVVSAATPR